MPDDGSLSLAASVGPRNGSFLFFVPPATRQNHTRDEEQSRLRSISLQLSCSLCVSLWVANKHSCLNKVVGTMPGPIGRAGGYWGGGSRLTHTSTICIAIPIGKMLLPGCLPLLCPSYNFFSHQLPRVIQAPHTMGQSTYEALVFIRNVNLLEINMFSVPCNESSLSR